MYNKSDLTEVRSVGNLVKFAAVISMILYAGVFLLNHQPWVEVPSMYDKVSGMWNKKK